MAEEIIPVLEVDDTDTPDTDEGVVVVEDEAWEEDFLIKHFSEEENVVSGTGGYLTFLRTGTNQSISEGINIDDASLLDDNGNQWNNPLKLSQVPIVIIDGVEYYEVRLDVNEPNNANLQLSLSELQIFLSTREVTKDDVNVDRSVTALGDDFDKVFDLDATTDKTLVLTDDYSGSGGDDYVLYIPVSQIDKIEGVSLSDTYVTFYAQFGPTPPQNSGFEEFRVRATIVIDGVKYADIDGDGFRDPGEDGIGGIKLFLDLDGNGVLSTGDRVATTEADGTFEFTGLPTSTTIQSYYVYELLTPEQEAQYILTTGNAQGGHLVTVSLDGTVSDLEIGNMPIIKDFIITKTVTSIADGPDATGGNLADGVGDTINYLVSITNTGNVPLTNVIIGDLLEGLVNVTLTPVTNGNGNAIFDVNETWTFTASYVLTQGDLDSEGGNDGFITNVATATAEYKGVAVGPKSDDVSTPLVYNPAINVTKAVAAVDAAGNGLADAEGDVIDYSIKIENTGNITLTGVTVTDTVEAYGATNATYVSGDTDTDGKLDVDEEWTFSASYTLTQDDLDGKGGGNELLDNVGTGDTEETDPDSDSETVPLVYNPAINVTKAVAAVDADGNGLADAEGDVIDYSIKIENTGNITLTGVTVTDTVEAYGATNATYVSGDTDTDGKLDVDEEWTFSASYTLTQDDLDGKGGGNELLDNVGTGDTEETDPDSDSETVPLVYNPAINVTKAVAAVDADGNGLADAEGDVIDYSIKIENTGNITLTGVTVTDTVEAYGATNATYVSGDTDTDGKLDVDEEWTFSASYTLTQDDLDGKGGGNELLDNVGTGDTEETDPDSDSETVPLVYNPAINVTKAVAAVDADGNGLADAEGDVIDYSIKIENTGNITLTGVTVTDTVEAYGATNATYVSGDTDTDGKLDVDEEWTFSASYTLTQDDLDGKGGGNELLDNVGTGDTEETDPDSDSETVPLVYNPAINVTKAVAAVDADGNGLADAEGDVIDYSIKIENTGNITLTGVTVTDTVEAYGATNATYVSGDTDTDGKLDVDEEWTFSASYTLTQDDLDGKGGGNELLDNVGTGDTEETDPDSDSETVPLVYNPKVDLEKYVSVTGAAGAYVDADSDATNPDNSFLGPNNVNIGSDVWFKVTVANTGNVTLTDVDISDENTTGGSSGTVFNLVVDGELTLNAITNFGATLAGDNGDGELDVGETWTIYYKQGFDPGQHINTATITTDENATDSDDAYYYSLINEGPGVGTPGFWGNLGGQFWDGKVNETKLGPNFPEGDLLIKGNTNGTVDSNGDQVVDGKDVGLLVGDYNMNGITDLGEDTLFIGLSDAKRLIDASQKTVNGDGVQMLGRDVVATWLNFLAGNNIGDADTDAKSPQHYIDDAIDWMQTFGGKNGNGAQNDLTDNIKTESFDIYDPAHATVKTSTPQWKSPQFLPDDPHSAAQLHNALDYYNNHGQTEPGGTQYAHDRDDATFAAALKVAQSAEYVGYADISSGDAVHDSAIMTNDQMLVI